MPILTIGVLNKLINNLPVDFTIEYENENTRFLLDEGLKLITEPKELFSNRKWGVNYIWVKLRYGLLVY